MRNWKRFLAVILSLCVVVATLCPMAAAEGRLEDSYITYYADGSYSVTSITYDEQQPDISARAAKKTISGTKKRDYYNRSNKLQWTFYVDGTFTYDGRSAEATSADYSYNIYDSAWSFSGGSAWYSGATATATGSFTLATVPNPVTLNLTCSANGTLS